MELSQVLDGKLFINELEVVAKNLEIYDISINRDTGIIFFSSDSGLYSYNRVLQKTELINFDIYDEILFQNSKLLAARDDLWEINGKNRTVFSKDVKYFNYSNEKICASDYKNVKIIDAFFEEEKELDINIMNIDYPIYALDCDKDWLWFSNEEGLYFFKWSNYEN